MADLSSEKWFNEGLRLRRAHQWKQASEAFERAARTDPSRALAWFWLAVSRDNRGEESKAIPAYRKAIKLGLDRQREAQAWTWLASSLSKTGRRRAALTSLNAAAAVGGYRPRAEYDRIRAAVERRVRRLAN